jgi:putative transcriptional regulator
MCASSSQLVQAHERQVGMSEIGRRLIESAKQARAYARAETTEGFVAHVPNDVDVKALRTGLGYSQAEFSRRFGFAIDAVQDWEQHRRTPDRTARILLKVIDREPDAVGPRPRRLTTDEGDTGQGLHNGQRHRPARLRSCRERFRISDPRASTRQAASYWVRVRLRTACFAAMDWLARPEARALPRASEPTPWSSTWRRTRWERAPRARNGRLPQSRDRIGGCQKQLRSCQLAAYREMVWRAQPAQLG